MTQIHTERCNVRGGLNHPWQSASESIQTVDQFRDWIRAKVRQILPHGALACGHGRMHAAGISLDYLLTVDYPDEHLQSIRNQSGGIDTPILRRWLECRQPQLFDAGMPWPDVDQHWLFNFNRYQLKNAAAHALIDEQSCIATYFSFHRLPENPGEHVRQTLIELVPKMHTTLAHVIKNHETLLLSDQPAWHLLTKRETEVVKLICTGKTNPEIAKFFGLSENTIKHHVGHILQKTELPNRIALVIAHTERTLSRLGGGTVVL
jgi:DNA-binding CsgD family transcriptional regulator